MIVAIVAAEVAFWVLLLGGLLLRYAARRRRASTLVLAAVPVVDVVLVAVVLLDVVTGAPPSRSHAFAALYLGVTVVFGPSLVRRTDARFAHRFDGVPLPSRPAKGSAAEVRATWVEWLRVVAVAAVAAVAAVVLGTLILLDGAPVPASVEDAATHPYWSGLLLVALISAIWFLAGPAFAGRGRPDHARPDHTPPVRTDLRRRP